MMNKFDEILAKTHEKCSRNKSVISCAEICGCFYCLEVFPASEVTEFIDHDDTALCPKCGIDSVLSDGDFPVGISKEKFLKAMYDMWFGNEVL